MGNFKNDLGVGKKYERLVMQHFQRLYNVEHAEGKHSPYDLLVKPCTIWDIPIEVKHDRMSCLTHNTAVELYKKTVDSPEIKPSGLSITEARIYVVSLSGYGVYWLFVDDLKQMVEDNLHFKVVDYSGDGNATVALFKVEEFVKHAKLLFKYKKEN